MNIRTIEENNELIYCASDLMISGGKNKTATSSAIKRLNLVSKRRHVDGCHTLVHFLSKEDAVKLVKSFREFKNREEVLEFLGINQEEHVLETKPTKVNKEVHSFNEDKNNIQLFKDEKMNWNVRTIMIDSEPWFVGRDVAESLGYAKARKAINNHVDSDDRRYAPIRGTLGGVQNMTVINESGLYSLILSSKLPEAKNFKRWVTKDILPSLRKSGTHSVFNNRPMDSYMIEDPVERAKRWIVEQEEKTLLEEQNKTLNEFKEKATPKLNYTDKVLQSNSLMTVTEVAADYGLSAQRLNKILIEEGVIYKRNTDASRPYVLTHQYKNKGYAKSRTIMIEHANGSIYTPIQLVWTQKGRAFINKLLKQRGVMPVAV